MGVLAEDTDRVVRFSSGWETTADNWQQLAKGVATVAADFSLNPRPSVPD
jgi:cysteine sulfinate desulfinase/cysteine desulfurase-like protein